MLFRIILIINNMDVAITQRIKCILKEKHVTATGLAEMAGMQAVTINRQLKGTNPIGYNLIDAVLNQFPDVSAEWLLRGEGNMIKGGEPTQKTEFIDIFLKGICNSDKAELDEYQRALTSVRNLRNLESIKNQ
uniref:HTH cro/C1-type domain-containing protein n=1 Tax=uncultured bacterium fosmid pJB83B9 TaxID=1478070 RepID=A0A0H3UAL4_9BACT|nr:hypothetical protein [uncultured bacterium fosmid pJB83B9]